MKGTIRIPKRYSSCPNEFCQGDGQFIDTGNDILCPNCQTKPQRFYLDIYFHGKRVRIFSDKQGQPLDTYERAYSLLAHINYEIDTHSFDPLKYIRSEQKEFYVRTQLEKYSDYKVNSLAPSYQGDFKRCVKIAKEFFQTKDVREIRKLDIINYQRHLEQCFKISNKTIKNILDVFKAFLNYLKNDLEIINTVPNFPGVDIDLKPFKWLSVEDQNKLYEFVPDKHKPLVQFLMLSGCRPSEARALRNKNVDLRNRTITISASFSGNVYREKRKGKKSRFVTIPIHPELNNYLFARVKNNLPEAFVFINSNTGRYYSKNAVQRVWSDVRKKAGIDKSLRLYDATRHSFASNLVNSGVTIYNVSKLLGHSSIKMTERYAHSEVENLRADVQLLTLNSHQTVINNVAYGKK